ncbi:MAG: exodeoxyribonuclease III [Pseudomonadota bacterium]
MKIATWNVNSINARLDNVIRWLKDEQPDVVLLQELKTVEEKFPLEPFTELGYNAAIHGQKSWNGVAILSKHEISDVLRGLPGDDSDEQSRYIEATINGIRLASIYLPNGNPVDTEKYPYKLGWMDRLYRHAAELLHTEMPVVLGGDYNIIPEEIDCYNPGAWTGDALFRLESRQKFRAIEHLGFYDAFRAINDNTIAYSYWDYKAGAWQQDHGIRIDHFLLSAQAVDRMENCEIDKAPRGEKKSSDHTPVILTL